VTYAPHLQWLNDWASAAAFVLGLSMLVFLYNLIYSMLFARVRAERNPWGSLSLEWQLPSPVPVQNFDTIPTFESDPYGYGDGGLPVARPSGVPARAR
jgi:cytochrome c oxidase subunit 1